MIWSSMYLACSDTKLHCLYRAVGIFGGLRKAMARKSSTGLQSAWLGLFEAAFLDGNRYNTSCINDG